LSCSLHGAIFSDSTPPTFPPSWRYANWPDTNATFVSARLFDADTALAVGFVNQPGMFVAGLALIKLFARRDLVEAHRAFVRRVHRPRRMERDFGRERWI